MTQKEGRGQVPDPTTSEPADGQEPQQAEVTSSNDVEGQEPDTFPRDYVEKLRQESAAARTSLRELEEKVREYEDQGRTETERLAARLEEEQRAREEAERAREQLQQERLREKIAREHGLADELVDRLRGDDEHALREDAARLSQLFAPAQTSARPVMPSFGGGPRGGDAPANPQEGLGRDLLNAVRAHKGR
jgi:hypothetical protein